MSNVSELKDLGANGYIDTIEGGRVYGWAWNAVRPDDVQKVAIYHQGECLGVVEANRYREDLVANKIGSGRHAFVFDLPTALRKSPVNEFSVQIEGSGMPLQRGSRVFTIKQDGTVDSQVGQTESEVLTDPAEIAHALRDQMKSLGFRIDKIDENYVKLAHVLTAVERRFKVESKQLQQELGSRVAGLIEHKRQADDKVGSAAELAKLQKYLKVMWRDIKKIRQDMDAIEVFAVRFDERLNQAAPHEDLVRLDRITMVNRGLIWVAVALSGLAALLSIYAVFFA